MISAAGRLAAASVDGFVSTPSKIPSSKWRTRSWGSVVASQSFMVIWCARSCVVGGRWPCSGGEFARVFEKPLRLECAAEAGLGFRGKRPQRQPHRTAVDADQLHD